MKAVDETPSKNIDDGEREVSIHVEISVLSLDLEESDVDENQNPLGLQQHI